MKGAYLFLKKYGVSISFAVGAVLTMVSILAITMNFPEGATMEQLYETSIFNTAINISFALTIIGALLAVIGPAIYTAFNFKDSLKFLIMTVVLILMYVISISMGVTPNEAELIFFQGVDNQHLTGADVAFIDGLLIFTSIMILLTLASLVFMGVWGLLKQ